MRVIVVVIVRVAVVRVHVLVIPVAMVRVVVLGTPRAVGVDSAFGSEGRTLVAEREPESSHHFVEHVIVLKSEPANTDLERHVPVAQVVRRAGEEQGVAGRRHAEILVGGHDFERPTVVGEQPIAAREHGAARQLDGDFLAALESRAKPRLRSRVVVEQETAIRRKRGLMETPDAAHGSKQEIALGEGQRRRRLAGEERAVRANFVGLRIDFDAREGVVVHHVALRD